MIKKICFVISAALFIATFSFASNGVPDTIMRNGLTLYFFDEESSITAEFKNKLSGAFFMQYPKLIEKYNQNSPRNVRFVMDKKYSGVAYASDGNKIVFNPAWFEKHPEDLDVVTHELMHLVQNYRFGNIPGWVTEGIADYVRATEGFNNVKGGWTMPDLKSTHSYTNSYRITARFLLWITQRYQNDFVIKLDDAARNGKYSEDFWKTTLGKTVDELWEEYTSNPEVQITYR